MSGRGNKAFGFAVLLLAVITVLQFFYFRQSLRLNRRLTETAESLERYITTGPPGQTAGGRAEQQVRNSYPGDEGDWRIWAFHVEPKTLNPISAQSDIYTRWIVVHNIFESLLMYDFETLEMKPHLAERWQVSADGLEITFYLRDDIYFSDGKPITAEDVVFTFETITDPMIDAASVASLFVDVTGAEALDETTVRFTFARRSFKHLENVCFWDFGILPKHIYDYEDANEFNKRVSNPVGSGPYLFSKWSVGSDVVLEKNPNYWGRRPNLQRIVYKFITNQRAAVQALLDGEVDMIIPDPQQYADLVEDELLHERFYFMEYWNPGVPFFYMGWNQKMEFFKDRRVRTAMTHIVDREKIVSDLLKNHAAMTSGPFFIKGENYDPAIQPLPYDLKRAGELLDEAGWADSDGDGIRDREAKKLSFKFSYAANNVIYRQLAKLFKDSAARAGVDVIPDPMEWSVLITRITDRDFESMVMGWGGDVLEDSYQIFHSSQIDNRGSNYVGFDNARADRLMERIRGTYDRRERAMLSHELHRILHEQQPYTFLFTRPTFRIVDRRFRNVNIYTLGPNYFEWYVPKELQKYN